ncbi:MAG TPA: HD domain-containing phosphohydrolase, partial [Myxococcaceae bacterium]|nr:HD domain-containing phosphohydrolase [Myxococcaceae bacterium]
MDRILLVDDDALILQALSRILKAEGYEVVAHSDPEQAATEVGFQVIITDFMMPKMNGIELLGVLRQTNPNAVRILLTAAADFKIASDGVNRGEIYRLLGKPWTLTELTNCVRQAVQHHHLLEENARLTREVVAKNEELVAINRNLEKLVVERTNGLLDGLISALDYRDTETQWHSRRVSLYSRRIAEAAGVHGVELDTIEQGALLHDIGKIGVPDAVLLKPGKLTQDEWKEMRKHPDIGHQMIHNIPFLSTPAQIVLSHQERWDGEGYPRKLKGPEIHIGARIFAVADTLDAMTSDRPYRLGTTFSNAIQEIQRCKGSQFDPEVVRAFVDIGEDALVKIKQEMLAAKKPLHQLDAEARTAEMKLNGEDPEVTSPGGKKARNG